MRDILTDAEIRQAKAGRRLGSHDRCHACPESNPTCLELHHIAGQANHEDRVPVCRNCHRKLSDAQRDHPDEPTQTMFGIIGHYLLGLADFFVELAKQLQEFGRFLCGYERELLEAE